MPRISPQKWGSYKSLIQNFIRDDAGLKPIVWLKSLSQPLPHGEDVGLTFFSKPLNVLISYNIYRTWPINQVTQSGEVDNETCCIYMPNDELSRLGYLNEHNYIDINPTLDRFVIDGIIYKASGETQAAQAGPHELATMVILKRLKDEKLQNYQILE